MRIAFYGSSLLSAYWNGAATYYRGILRALAARGYDITFFEPDAHGRQQHRDIEVPDWARVVVYPATPEGVSRVLEQAPSAEIVVKASGVGYADDALLEGAIRNAAPGALRVFWDVDAPATLAEVEAAPGHPLRAALGELDLVLTYGGGPPVVDAYRRLGARDCVPIYNALDPATHHPVDPDLRFVGDLGLLANRLPDREERIRTYFVDAARALPRASFLLGGSGWERGWMPDNVHLLGHVGTAEHNAFNCSPRAILNVSREGMSRMGHSPATRVFEAAGAGACLISDAWEGIERFLTPGSEVLVARDGADVADLVSGLTRERAASIGRAARTRILAEHTYDRRAEIADGVFADALARRRVAAE